MGISPAPAVALRAKMARVDFKEKEREQLEIFIGLMGLV
jgi:hypothetical protein